MTFLFYDEINDKIIKSPLDNGYIPYISKVPIDKYNKKYKNYDHYSPKNDYFTNKSLHDIFLEDINIHKKNLTLKKVLIKINNIDNIITSHDRLSLKNSIGVLIYKDLIYNHNYHINYIENLTNKITSDNENQISDALWHKKNIIKFLYTTNDIKHCCARDYSITPEIDIMNVNGYYYFENSLNKLNNQCYSNYTLISNNNCKHDYYDSKYSAKLAINKDTKQHILKKNIDIDFKHDYSKYDHDLNMSKIINSLDNDDITKTTLFLVIIITILITLVLNLSFLKYYKKI